MATPLFGTPKSTQPVETYQPGEFQAEGLRLSEMQWTIGHADLTAAATSETITLTPAPPAHIIPIACLVELDTEFSGGAVSACVVKVGDTGDDDEWLTSSDIFTGAGAGIKQTTGAAMYGKMPYESAYAPKAIFTTTTANVSVLDAGALTIRLFYVRAPPAT